MGYSIEVIKTLKKMFHFLGIDVKKVNNRNFDAILKEIFSVIGLDHPILDVGAHNGSSVRRFRSAFGPKPEIFSFEANPELFKLLKQDHSLSANLKVYNNIVCDKNDEIQAFNIHQTSTGSSSMLALDFNTRFAQRRGVTEETISICNVPTISLDFFTSKLPNSRISLLKIDTQGSELDVLNGAIGLLSRSEVDVIEFELITHSGYVGRGGYFEVLNLLDKNGYKLIAISNDSRWAPSGYFDLLKNPELQFDLIFVSPLVFKKIAV
jgi:FkbM family methyltransferase